MAFFDKIIDQLFPASDSHNPTLIQEQLIRSQKYTIQFEDWKNSKECKNLLTKIRKAYYYRKSLLTDELQVHLFNTIYANGFALTYHPTIGKKVFSFLLDLFRERAQSFGYRLLNADRRIAEKVGYMETIEKFFLKPPSSEHPTLINQMFGNIIIESVMIDDEPSYLKIMANIYSDRLYTEALPFDDLLEIMLASE